MRRVLVLGGAGLVGSHLCDRLLAERNEVIAVDDFASGSFANVAHLKREPRFVFEEHDVSRPFRAEVEAVFHLALPSSRARLEADPVRGTVTSVMGTLHALETARAYRAPLVLGISTERWGEGLRCAESLVAEFGDVDVRRVYVPPTYGPRSAVDDPHVVVQLVLQAVRREPLRPSLPLDHVVRVAYVDHVVDTLLAIESGATVAPFVEARVADIVAAVADSGAQRALVASGVRPTSSSASSDLRDGVASTMRWFEERVAAVRVRGVRRRVLESGKYPISIPTNLPTPIVRRKAG